MTKTIRAVERAVDILLALGGAKSTMDVAELQQEVRLSRGTLYRVLHTLECRGLVRADGTPQRYRLDFRVIQLSNAWLKHVDAAHAGQAHLKSLWERTGETVGLFIPVSNGLRLCVQELRSREPLALTLGVGHAAPLHRGAAGKAILAFLPDEKVDEVIRALGSGEEQSNLRAKLDRVRRLGFAVSHADIIRGATSIGTPLFDQSNAVVGSIALFGPDARIKGGFLDRCSRLLRETGARISSALGHQGGGIGVGVPSVASRPFSRVRPRRGRSAVAANRRKTARSWT